MIGAAGRVYLECAVLLTVAWCVLWASRRVWLWSGGSGSARAWLRWALAVLVAAAVLPPAARLLPDALFHAVGLGPRAKPEGALAGGARHLGMQPAGPAGAPPALGLPRGLGAALPWGGAWAVALLGGLSAATALVRYRSLRRHLDGLPVMRTLGRVRLCVSDAAGVPYAARTAGGAFVVVPTEAVADWPRLRLVVAHELQHHRQGDTVWVHALAALRTGFAWLPAAYGWGRLLSELQEMACDEAVLERRPWRAQAYARAIVCAVERGRGRVLAPAGTTAAAGGSSRILRRRLEMIVQRPTKRSAGPGRLGLASLGIVLAAGLAARAQDAPAPAAAGVATDTALEMAVPTNDLVLAELKQLQQNRKRRDAMQAGLERMERHRAAIEATLRRHGLPQELMAVPLIESSFENLEASSPLMASLAPDSRGAGLWMFIPQTARACGLRVDGTVDERLDIELQTEAAARYLGQLYREFGDWPLALAAYNQGPGAVKAAIRRGRSRDAWALQRQGLLNNYHSLFMAAALVLRDQGKLC